MNQNNYIGIALEELYRIFEILNKNYYEEKLETPMITIQKAKRSGNLGWFTFDKVWEKKDGETQKYEINICPEYLNQDAHTIVDTLQHESVHYLNRTLGIKDCNGKVHNKKFKELAEKMGLIVTKSKQCGFGHTSCSDEFKKFIDEDIKPNMDAFSYFRSLPNKEPKPQREKKTFKYVCPECKKVVKAEPDMNVVCGQCEVEFVIEDK